MRYWSQWHHSKSYRAVPGLYHFKISFKNCIGFYSSFLGEVLPMQDWHSMVLALLWMLLSISSCHGIFWSQHSLAALSSWDDKGAEYLFHEASGMFWGRRVAVWLIKGVFKVDWGHWRIMAFCFLSKSLLIVPWAMNFNSFSVQNTVLSCWMSLSAFH